MNFLILFVAFAFTKEIDYNTFSNYLDAQITHLSIEWLLDLEEKKTIDGIIEYNMHVSKDNLKDIYLDIYKLSILRVYKNDVDLVYGIDSPLPESNQGERLHIELDRVYNKDDTLQFRIKYQIDERSRSISFMTKEQTQTGTHPYMFSKCETANCRALAPLQDTPAIKQTYDAVVLWKNIWTKDINAYMSADFSDQQKPLMGTYADASKLTRRNFALNKPIPSYLIAIVAGNISRRPTSSGGRTYVISEDNSKLNEYVFELQDMENFLQALESYIGPYTWGTYTIVILPASFPSGAMENPLLTFANPTIMVGDGSGLAVATHEMAHSWFGNTVTCINWSNPWLNEGFTVFLERKASLAYYSSVYSYQKAKDMVLISAASGNSSMVETMQSHGFDHTFSSLHPEVKDINPDLAFNTVCYEKGYQLLVHLESIIGTLGFQKMLRDYVAFYSWQSIGVEEFYQFMIAFVTQQQDATNKLNKINLVFNTWVYQAGIPPVIIDLSTPAITDAQNLALAYIAAQGKSVTDGDKTFNSYLPNQKHIFLQHLIDNISKVTSAILTAIDTQLKLTSNKDSEIKYRWFRANLLAKDQSRNQYIIPFLQTTGRGKMIYPVYEALKNINLALAQKTFTDAIKFYHPIARQNLQAMLFNQSVD